MLFPLTIGQTDLMVPFLQKVYSCCPGYPGYLTSKDHIIEHIILCGPLNRSQTLSFIHKWGVEFKRPPLGLYASSLGALARYHDQRAVPPNTGLPYLLLDYLCYECSPLVLRCLYHLTCIVKGNHISFSCARKYVDIYGITLQELEDTGLVLFTRQSIVLFDGKIRQAIQSIQTRDIEWALWTFYLKSSCYLH